MTNKENAPTWHRANSLGLYRRSTKTDSGLTVWIKKHRTLGVWTVLTSSSAVCCDSGYWVGCRGTFKEAKEEAAAF